MERNLVLPAKVVCIWLLYLSFFSSPWMGSVSDELGVAYEFIQYFFRFYIAVNAVFALVVLAMHRLPLALIQWGVFAISLVDGLFVAALTLITGGYDSILFWIFVALIVRNAVSMPPTMSQIALNLGIIGCYILGVVVGLTLADNLPDETVRALGLFTTEPVLEPLLLRLFLLLLLTVCCYGLQILLEREQRKVEEAQEFTAREVQLRSAGRLAAEFAHQIKNPLAIINNAVFSLQRSVRDGKTTIAPQIEIIQEEVAHADRVITQIMGYAQLSEGHVEKLNVIEELDRAIAQVFPPAVPTGIKIHREYGHGFPPLLMQRGHLSEILVNLLKNAGEALGETGNVFVAAGCDRNHSVEISVRDTGSGIPPDKIERVFEAYYTTKERGTGLGLAIVKHNVELYGGSVCVESELGKGSNFTLIFPAKALMKLSLK
jgi:signal transduction histidine kinase